MDLPDEKGAIHMPWDGEFHGAKERRFSAFSNVSYV
jgi:hypothetical protein